MMDRLDNPSKLKAAELADELKGIMQPLYQCATPPPAAAGSPAPHW